MFNNQTYKLKILLVLLTCNNFLLSHWNDAEPQSQNAVVHVSAQVAKFNWTEPYKSPDQMQFTGTAFFINEKGDMLTNFHVIDEAKSIYINLPALCGQKELEVKTIGVYPECDLALLGLTEDSYNYIMKTVGYIPYLNLGDSDTLYRTQPILALGYPLNSRYIKSTLGAIAGYDFPYIHMTAPINPGNSGGPLIDINGNVVGINTAIIPKAQNVCYIIPINDAKKVLDDMYNYKLYRKTFLGTVLNHSTDEHATILNNPLPAGVYINHVIKDSIADKLGIQEGDMLYKINWKNTEYQVDSYGDIKADWRNNDQVSIVELINKFDLKDDIQLTVYRNGTELNFNFTLEFPERAPLRYIHADFEPEETDYEIIGGAVIMQLRLNHLALKQFNNILSLTKYQHPDLRFKEVLLITNIFPGSAIALSNCLYPGMLIDKVNNKKVNNLKELREAILESKTSRTLSITSKQHYSTVISIDKILKEEPRLALSFRYKISDTVMSLINNK